MYRILADDVLIYDSTLEDYKLGKGQVTLEVNKSGSFVFSVYPDHFYYDRFVNRKTVITVYKSGRIVFRGRILNDVTDYWNIKTFTCEGELGFLLDSVARPFSFTGAPADLFRQFIEAHNDQVDDFKKFNVGTVTVKDGNNYINRSSTDYGLTLNTLQGSLTGSALGGYFYITHGEDGTDLVPTLHYLDDFDHVARQTIKFGENLKDYTKTVKSEDVVTAIIPLGAEVSNADVKTRLTIADVNGGRDYVYSQEGIDRFGWIFASVTWDDVTLAQNLKTKAEEYLQQVINQTLTIELNAIDLHMLDRSIESFRVCDYVRVVSAPHNIDAQLLCNKQTLDLLNPGNDSIVLGYSSPTLSGVTKQLEASISTLGKDISTIKQTADTIEHTVEKQGESVSSIIQTATGLEARVESVEGGLTEVSQSVNSITLGVSNGTSSSTISLSIDGVIVASKTVKFTGDIVFESDLSTKGSTKINGGNITSGTISADRIDTDGIIEQLGEDGMAELSFYDGRDLIGSVSAVDDSDTLTVWGAEDVLVTCATGDATVHGNNDVYIEAATGEVQIDGGNTTVMVNDDGMSVDNDLWVDGTKIASSDRDVKNTMTYDLDDFAGLYRTLKPCRFKYNNGKSGRFHTGFIAQEVEQAIADAGFADTDLAVVVQKNHGTEEAGKYGVRYEEIIALNTAMVQKLMDKVEALEAELATLKGGA